MNPVPKQWLETVVQHSSDAVIIIDRERIIRFANTAAARMAGAHKPEAIVGSSYDAHLQQSRILDEYGNVPPKEWYPTYWVFTEGRITRDLVLEQIHRGTHYWLSVTCVPIKGESGKVEYAILYFRDISRRKLREDKLRFLVESSKSLSLTTDFNTRLSQKARLMVPSLADWCTVNVVEEDGSISRTAIVHRDESKEPLVEELAVYSAREMDPATAGVYSVITTGEPKFLPHISWEEMASQGMQPERIELAQALQVCSSMILPIISSGKVVGVLSLAFAESGRHYSEEDLAFMREYCNHLGLIIDNARLYEQISRRDKAKDSFLATLSHELRNPLAPIKSSLELLKLQAESEGFAEEVRVIEHQFNHMARLLNDLLDVSRYSRGMISLEQEHVSVRELIERIVRIHEPYFTSKNLRLDVALPQEELAVWGDATRLEQSITNILHNAAKFTPEGGLIAMRVRADGEYAVISVRDSGTGMDRAELATLFDINAPRSPSKEHGGLGIGLLLVGEIVKLHGGRVVARSDGPGTGSEFELLLPLMPTAHDAR